jgi:MFS transporter, ACS family, pantothenate transporter
VLLIGGGVSSTDIAREIGQYSKNIYQSTRNSTHDLPTSLLPGNAVRIGEITSFEVVEANDIGTTTEFEPGSLPLIVNWGPTEQLTGIHHIIVCTGYHITLPFLRRFHHDDTLPEDAGTTVLVTDGTQLHNLHKDIFYIPDPTLAFVGVAYYTATFTLFEFQAMVVATVFSGLAKMPSNDSMRMEYNERVVQKGYGRDFHSLKNTEETYVNNILAWVNAGRNGHGLSAIEGHTAIWLRAKEEQRARARMLFGEA